MAKVDTSRLVSLTSINAYDDLVHQYRDDLGDRLDDVPISKLAKQDLINRLLDDFRHALMDMYNRGYSDGCDVSPLTGTNLND